MPQDTPAPARSSLLIWALLAWVLGTAAQLQQSQLWGVWIYLAFGLLALALEAWAAIKRIADPWRIAAVCVSVGMLAFAVTGTRALWFASGALEPALEGRDVVVQGLVAGLPQRNETGLRFRLDVESATLDGQAVTVPRRIDVAWYGGVYALGTEQVSTQRPPEPVQAGERWRMAVRLKAPHGGMNPNGFDFELWAWEQGVQASGYVRAGPRDMLPQRVSQTAWHPVDWLRQQLRDRIVATVEQRQTAGLIAALVVGDQNAIVVLGNKVLRSDSLYPGTRFSL